MTPDNVPRARPKLPKAGASTSFTANQVCGCVACRSPFADRIFLTTRKSHHTTPSLSMCLRGFAVASAESLYHFGVPMSFAGVRSSRRKKVVKTV